jgi:16S rRNA (guanine1516-N2)-methyltransferase
MFVTTAVSASYEEQQIAIDVARKNGWIYLNRKRDTLNQLRKKIGESGWDSPFLVYVNGIWRWYTDPAAAVFFHPSMAYVRLKRLLHGEADVMLSIAKIQSGETILDCTAGMASDSIVFSHAIGSSGKVIALESTPALAFLVQQGLQNYQSVMQPLVEAMRRINIVNTDHLSYLQKLPDQSVDVVYFDPMFRKRVVDANVLDPIRLAVNNEPLHLDAIVEAKRVARRLVMLKELKDSPEFARLGFKLARKPSGKIAYGVIER